MKYIFYNFNLPRSDLFEIVRSRYSTGDVECISFIKSRKISLLSRIVLMLISPIHIIYILIANLGRPAHFIFLTQPPLLQPIYAFLVSIFGHRFSILIYDYYLSIFSLSKYPHLRFLSLISKPFWCFFLLRCRHVFVLSLSMKSLIKSSLDSNLFQDLTFIYVDLSSHFLFNDLKYPITASSLVTKEYDICYVGSFSAPHSIAGFIRLIRVLPYSSNILISESVFKILENHLHCTRQTLNCYKFNDHNFTVLPYSSSSSYKSEVLKSKIGFVSLKKHYIGTCFPSRIFTYLELGIPVLFDGNKDSIDSLLSVNEMGLEVDVLNTPNDQLVECLYLLSSSTIYPTNSLNYINKTISKPPLPLFP